MSIVLVPSIIMLFLLTPFSTLLILHIALILHLITLIVIIANLEKQQRQIAILEKEHNVLHDLFQESPLSMVSFNKELEVTDSNMQFTVMF